MPYLPNYRGLHRVGLSTFTKPIRPCPTYGNAQLANGEKALKMEEVAFSVFYPAAPADKAHKGVPWLMRPVSTTLGGWAEFSGVPKWLLSPAGHLLAAPLDMPVYPNAPLLEPTTSGGRWPLVLFSHGLLGGRSMYSQFCGRLASEGFVVIALEHRDGTGPAVVVRSETGKMSTKHYLKPEQVTWPENASASQFTLREDQLLFRTREIYEAHNAFAKMVSGEEADLHMLDESEYNPAVWKDRVQCKEDITLAGHSFGGATVLTLLGNPPPNNNPLPISRVICLDPWVEPIAGFVPPLDETRPPIIVLNSEGFTLWTGHFERLHKIISDWKTANASHGTLLTIVRSEHQSFSDFPVILPLKGGRALKTLDVVHRLSLAFIHDTVPQELAKLPKRIMEIDGKPGKKMLKGNENDIVIHLE